MKLTKKTKARLHIDTYGCVINNAESALYVRQRAIQDNQATAISLTAGEATMFHMTFVPLQTSIPIGVTYSDGSVRGLQINIDRVSSYALPWDNFVNEEGYLMEKWGLTRPDAEALLPFINTVLTGENHFKKNKKEKALAPGNKKINMVNSEIRKLKAMIESLEKNIN